MKESKKQTVNKNVPQDGTKFWKRANDLKNAFYENGYRDALLDLKDEGIITFENI